MLQKSVSACCCALVLLAAAFLTASLPLFARVSQAAPAGEVVWIEGEAPSAVTPATLKPVIESDGKPEYLSAGEWLHISVEGKDVGGQVPADGITLSYKFTLKSASTYDIWDRVGYENARSPFEWRIDGGAWTTVTPDDATTDVMELQTWNPVGWLKLTGAATPLAAGEHLIEIRLTRRKDAKGDDAAVQYASDALCIAPAGAFRPNGPYRPGDLSWRTEADAAASAHVFTIEPGADSARSIIPLTGAWQIARDDEAIVHDPSGPMTALPDSAMLFWKSMSVPGDRDKDRPEWLHSHRYLLRTRIEVPSALAGHSFHLHFPAISLIATVFVNGQVCGWTKSPFAQWDCDVTRAVKPGQTNEIVVGIKDWFYALPGQGAREGEHLRYSPTDWIAKFGPIDWTFPVWNHTDNGILRTPSLVVAGPAYTADVFTIPSVRNKSLGLEITVHNPSAQELTVQVANVVWPLGSGPSAMEFAAKALMIPAGGDGVLKLAEQWTNPKLWWPDAPQQYDVVTSLSVGDKIVDETHTKFGFREWRWDGPNFTLNGIPWHGRADVAKLGPLGDEWLKKYHAHGQTMVRIWEEHPKIDEDLDWYDAHGVCVRRTGLFDGEAAKYNLTDGRGHVKQELFDNWRAQLLDWIRGQRNHPSIFIWSIENEIAFINGHVFGTDAVVDPAEREVGQAVLAFDPTRPAMTDGGNALLDESMPVYGGHYMEPPFQTLPEGAYDDRAAFTHRQVWPVTQSKPILLGEAYYANGNEPADFATVGGDAPFVGKAEAGPAIGLTARMLSEGYRWNGVNFHFWEGDFSDAYYNSWQPVAVLCREWDSAFASGAKVPRTLAIFNDSRKKDPIILTSTLTVGGKTVFRQSTVHTVAPGQDERFTVTLPMPVVVTRQEGQWSLTLVRDGAIVFTDIRPLAVLPKPTTAANGGAAAAAERLAVYDPNGSVSTYLRASGTAFTPLSSLKTLPPKAKVLLIGRDALTGTESTSTALAAYAADGHAVVVLEQKTPLHFQALPGEMATDTNRGDIAFAEDPDNPILRGLRSADFVGWGPDGVVYQNAYAKPTSGGRSLIQCDFRLRDTALAQLTPGNGILLLSQLAIGEKIAANVVAQRVLRNLLDFAGSYKRVHRPVSVTAAENQSLIHALDAMGLRYDNATDVLLAIAGKTASIAIVEATPANLHVLATNPAKLHAFTSAGGWLILNNLTPEGLADYNRIVGVDHVIRPFRREKVSLSAVRNPLTAGLATSDVVMGSGKQIFPFAAGQYPDTDAFSYVVDYDDIAPFAKSSFGAFDNIVNNYTMADGFWPLIANFPAPADGSPYVVPMTLPRPERVTQFTWVSDNNYEGTTKVNLVFGGVKTIPFDTAPNGEAQKFPVVGAPSTADVTLQIAAWQHDPAHRRPDGSELVGIDNIYLKVARSDEFYRKVKPLLNIGALVAYPQGAGGVVLCNVKYKDSEANPENLAKKRAILATVLTNLQAPLGSGKTVIAGARNLAYAPVDLSHFANQFVTDQGWFGDRHLTFADLPTGRQVFADVPYSVYSFATSPVPTVVMLGGSGIPGNLPEKVSGIAVNRKADALFFLQAAHLDLRRRLDEIRNDKRYEMADYVVHYADGKSVTVPIYAEIDVDDYAQKSPSALPGAQLAWTEPYPNSDQRTAAYSMQWNNPRPDVAITSVDLTYGPDRRGAIALLALTAATAER